MMSPFDAAQAKELVARWDDQQAAYIADREGRFTAICDVVALSQGTPRVIIDLACGPGSLAFRLAEKFPNARIIGVDVDPVLLRIARYAGEEYGDRVAFISADLAGDWASEVRNVADDPINAVVSSTALHWLEPEQIVSTYRNIASVLDDGGVFCDGDHFRFEPSAGPIYDWSARHDVMTQEGAWAAGADNWESWWSMMLKHEGFEKVAREREEIFATKPPTGPTSVEFRLAALQQGGFSHFGTCWQLFDDYVVYGVK